MHRSVITVSSSKPRPWRTSFLIGVRGGGGALVSSPELSGTGSVEERATGICRSRTAEPPDPGPVNPYVPGSPARNTNPLMHNPSLPDVGWVVDKGIGVPSREAEKPKA
jgi:hypothetical protein